MREVAGRNTAWWHLFMNFEQAIYKVIMVNKKVISVLGLLAVFSSANAANKEVTVCIVDQKLKNNPQYFALPNTGTALICDKVANNVRPNLNDMYRNGWSLVQVVQPDPRLGGGNKVVSPMIYFEREKVEAKKKKSSSNSGGFSLFD